MAWGWEPADRLIGAVQQEMFLRAAPLCLSKAKIWGWARVQSLGYTWVKPSLWVRNGQWWMLTGFTLLACLEFVTQFSLETEFASPTWQQGALQVRVDGVLGPLSPWHRTVMILLLSSTVITGLTSLHSLVIQMGGNCAPPVATFHSGAVASSLSSRPAFTDKLPAWREPCQGISCSDQFLMLLCSSLLSNHWILSSVERLAKFSQD